MFGWLKRRPSVPASLLAMIGPRASDAVLFLGATSPAFAAEVGTVTRLNGRTVVVARGAEAAKRTDLAATQAGAIVEFVDAPVASLPFDGATFHIVVAPDPDWSEPGHPRWLIEAVRVLRPGGRILVLQSQSLPTVKTIIDRLAVSGLVATRLLATTEGLTYYEGRKARQ